MRQLLEHKAAQLDRAVLLLIVLFNLTVLAKLSLSLETLIGAVNASTAASLLVASLWCPTSYAHCRMAPIVLMRLLVCAVPLVSDTVGPFGPGFGDRPSAARQAGHALFMLLVSISWALGLFLGPFLLLPPAHHLAVQAASLAVLMLRHNRAACEGFLAQHPGNGAVVDVTDAALRAVITAAVPAAGLQLEELGDAAGPAARCVAGVAAMQVSLGLVLPTILAWQLQSRMASSIAAQAAARRDAAMVAQVRGSQHAKLCDAVAAATQHFGAKLLLVASSSMLTWVVALTALAEPPALMV